MVYESDKTDAGCDLDAAQANQAPFPDDVATCYQAQKLYHAICTCRNLVNMCIILIVNV